MSEVNNNSIQKFLRSEMSFYGTIVVAVMTIATMYFGLTNGMNLINQKLEYFAGNYQDILSKYVALEVRVVAAEKNAANHEKDIALLQAQISQFNKP